MEALGVPTICVVSDQFLGLGLAVRSGMQKQLGVATGPSFVVVPYPVSGLDPVAVEKKAIDAAPDVADEILFRLGDSFGTEPDAERS